MQEAQAAVAERERSADDAVRVGLSLQQENDGASKELAARRAAVQEATNDLRTLKLELDALIQAVGSGVDATAAGEARASATWELARQHVASLAAGEAVTAEALATPVIEARLRYSTALVRWQMCIHQHAAPVPARVATCLHQS